MATVRYDLEPSRYDTDFSGNTLVRGFTISGLLNGPALADLVDETFAELPAKGTPAPDPLNGLRLQGWGVERYYQERNAAGAPINSWGGFGSLRYRTPTFTTPTIEEPDANGPGITVSTTTSVEEFETPYDINGNQITTFYDQVTQAHTIRGFRTLRSHVFVRPEDANPRSRRDGFEGKLNATIWNGYAVETVLLQTIADTTNDNESWEVEYTFVIRNEGWKVPLVHEDPFFPGHPLPLGGLSAPEIANATYDAERFFTVDFGPLNITLG